MAQLIFDATKVDPSAASMQIPVSDGNGHPVIVCASAIEPTKDQDSGFLKLTLEVIDGPHKGARSDWRLNLYNKSEKAVEIAYKQLSALCHVTGQYQINDSTQLHNIPFRAIVALQKKAKPEDPDYTEIKGVKDIHGADPGKSNGAPAQQQPVQQPVQQGQQQAGWAQQPQQQPVQQPAQQPQQPQVSQPVQGQPWQQQPQQQPVQQEQPQQFQQQVQPVQTAPVQQPWQQQASAGNPAWGQQK